jgi:hypothetical protein
MRTWQFIFTDNSRVFVSAMNIDEARALLGERLKFVHFTKLVG